ncbi:MAG: tetratricopeptide repeat protein, partial [Acidobacteria bacterium]|nr:tetratricopeptide repeat protein [Acidobacteriota bacterium]
PIINNNVASLYYLKNDLNSAIEQSQRALEVDPNFPQAHTYLGYSYLKQRRYEEAEAEFRKAVESSGRAGTYLSDLGYFFAITGKRAEAMRILEELEGKYARREAIGMFLAGVYVGLGEREKAFIWLRRDFEQRSGLLPQITWWFNFEDLRSDQRFIELVWGMGIEPR